MYVFYLQTYKHRFTESEDFHIFCSDYLHLFKMYLMDLFYEDGSATKSVLKS